MQPLRAIAAAATAARQWLRLYLASAKWRSQRQKCPGKATGNLVSPSATGPSNAQTRPGLSSTTTSITSASTSSSSSVARDQHQESSLEVETLNPNPQLQAAGTIQECVVEAPISEAACPDQGLLQSIEINEVPVSGGMADAQGDEQMPDAAHILGVLDSRKPGEMLNELLRKWCERLRPQVVGQVLQDLTDGDLALEFFGWAAEEAGFRHDTFTTNCLLFTLIKAGKSSKAYEIFSQGLPAGCEPDSFMVSTILYGLSQSGELHKACEFYEKLKEIGVVPFAKVFSGLILALCNAGNVDLALRLAREHTADPSAYAFSYSILIHALCKLKRTKVAWFLFYEMQERGGTLDATVYGSLMYGLCKAGDIRRACELLEGMSAKGCTPNVIIYTTLIDGFCKAQKVEHALEVLRIMDAKGFAPNVVTYSALIDGLCKGRDIDRAQKLLREMIEKGCTPNVVTYSGIIDGLCKARRMDEAIESVKEMLRQGCEPDLVTYNSLIHGFCLVSKITEASWILDELIEKGFAPNDVTYCTLVVGSCRARKIDKAYSFLLEMIQKGSVCSLALYIDLIYGFCEANCRAFGSDGCCAIDEVGALFKLLDEMVRQVSNEDHMKNRGGVAFGDDSFYDPLSRLDRAEQVLDFMHQKGCVPDHAMFKTLQHGLVCIRELRNPKLPEATSQIPFGLTE